MGRRVSGKKFVLFFYRFALFNISVARPLKGGFAQGMFACPPPTLSLSLSLSHTHTHTHVNTHTHLPPFHSSPTYSDQEEATLSEEQYELGSTEERRGRGRAQPYTPTPTAPHLYTPTPTAPLLSPPPWYAESLQNRAQWGASGGGGGGGGTGGRGGGRGAGGGPQRHSETFSSRTIFGHFPKRPFGGGGDEPADRKGYLEFNVQSGGGEKGNPLAIQAPGGGAGAQVW